MMMALPVEEICEQVCTLLETESAGKAEKVLLQRLAEGDLTGSEKALLLSELGNVRVKLGRTDEAWQTFQEALRSQSGDRDEGAEDEGPAEPEEDDWENAWEESLSQLTISRRADGERQRSGEPSAAPTARRPGPPPGNPPARREAEGSRRSRAGASAKAGAPQGRTCEHVLEVYNLPVSSVLIDVERFVEGFHEPRFEAKPVVRPIDEYHALAVFSTPAQAREALAESREIGFPMRPFSEASAQAQSVPDSELEPPTSRPKTTSSVARRLLGSALGIDLADRAADRELRDRRRAKKDAEKAKRDALEAAWDD
uniref:Uncharacterized protein n=1 Tax=Tetraselmis sp. GSL018 TaxID=582737 RepID=A0A061QLL0_9CHLO